MKKRVERPYWLMALFGLAATLGLILASYLLSADSVFSAPFGLGFGFVLSYYLFSLTFFVIFTAAAAVKMKSVHKGKPGQWFGFSLLSFTIGSVLASLAFLALLALVLVI